MQYTIGTLLKNKQSGSMALIHSEIPVVDAKAWLATRWNLGRENYTKEELRHAKLRGMTIKEEEGDKWEDTCYLIHRLTFTDPTIRQDKQMPYHHNRIHIDWEIVAE